MPRVTGLDAFAEAMSDCKESFVLIGGTACSILFEEAGSSFRATKDLDVVLLADGDSIAFGKILWDFVVTWGYECGRHKDGKCAYYRFNLPKGSPHVNNLPGQIELFSRHPDFALANEGGHVAPVPLDETVRSLSAIVLDNGYYEFIKSNTETVGNIQIPSALCMIPLKMRAHIDNNRLHAEGVPISEKVLMKHRKDVCELAYLLAPDARLKLDGQLGEDARLFTEDLRRYTQGLSNRKRRTELEQALGILSSVYL